MRTFVKRMLGLGALAALGYAAWRAFERRKIDTGITWDAQPFPYPPQPHHHVDIRTEAVAAEPTATWVEANGGTCPVSHPVKAKLASGIFHVPGGGNYDRTNPDRCYVSPEAAEADGLRAAKR